jgi:hypothetical protein
MRITSRRYSRRLHRHFDFRQIASVKDIATHEHDAIDALTVAKF